MFDSESERPLYLQLVDVLEKQMKDTMSPNEKLSSERELTQIFGVSRITVRLALQELEKRGLVYKKHGKGTCVSEIPSSAWDLSSAYSFTEQMRKIGKKPQTQILSFIQTEASEQVAKELQINMGDLVFELERLRLADGMPIMLERSYVPAAYFVDLTQQDLEEKPLYEIFEKDYHQHIRLAEEEFYASVALDNEAHWLQIKGGTPVLHFWRKAYNDKNIIIEYTLSIARADQFRYKVYHRRGE
ncbi:GntR family transcriptional regulator [Streptococcus sp. X16XC17]|uniref:GntR family transcriptional regulator n=1 Tax=unclassified Streptococcus TaxID=2608887 RepID=UPI00066FBF0E|nr:MULTISPECIES: GntR family transcriptional regulator [unclassified Streptococcus]TCD45956.1 GntR family transcriptional regulator [Streptococcus sp. X16XC17]